MKCDKLFKEAFEGIEFRYKLDDTLENLGNQKLTAKQLEGFLLGKGVSPKEIKQSSILKGMENDNRALSGSEWLSKSGSQRLTTYNVAPDELSYDTYTLGRKGTDNETLTTIKKPSENAPSTTHFSNEIDTPVKSLLGWRRTHVDEINGKKTLVLNELQSDWAQTERAGRGTFESNATFTKEITKEDFIDYLYDNAISGKDLTRSKIASFEEDFGPISGPEDLERFADEYGLLDDLNELTNYGTGTGKLVADFPMTELKHNQFQIVGAIDEALKQGIDTVAIPIQRENELVGSAGVTKFYESLNTKILPDIRKKLEKQGLRIKVDKKPYISTTSAKDKFIELRNEWPSAETAEDIDFIDSLFKAVKNNEEQKFKSILDSYQESAISDDLFGAIDEQFSDLSRIFDGGNDLWTLTIEEIPNGKVKWDVYSVLSALGLGSYANNNEEQ